jgi:hypothetical protein
VLLVCYIALQQQIFTCNRFVFAVNLKEKDHLRDQGIDGRMGSKWTVGRLVGEVWSGFTWLMIGIVGGLL